MTDRTVEATPLRGSVVKGSGVLILARILGMVGGFVLFLLITWRSREATGIFRTAMTYFLIMDTLPLLGMHRWLAAEIARDHGREAEIFWMVAGFAVAVSVAAAGVYFAIAASGIYQAEASTSLRIVALATVPCALNLCVMTAFVGLGYSHLSGLVGLAETLARTAIAIVLVLAGVSVVWVLTVFALVRWSTALTGLAMIRSYLPRSRLPWNSRLFRSFLAQVPNLAVSMVGFLLIRSTAMLLLPWLCDETEAGIYAAPFQLFDLLLLVPTVLAISSNFVFVASAKQSLSRLRRNTNELLSITAMFVCPFAAMGCILAHQGIAFLFGPSYAASAVPFQILMAAAVMMALDLVLASTMGNARAYRLDRICIASGAVVTVVLTVVLTKPFGATGASWGLLAGATCTLVQRLRLMGPMLNLSCFASMLRQQALPTLSAAGAAWLALAAIQTFGHADRAAAIFVPALVGMGLTLAYYRFGGLSARRFSRIKSFMAQRG